MHPDIKQFVKHYPIEFDDDLCAVMDYPGLKVTG